MRTFLFAPRPFATFGLAAALALGACLKDAPLVQPERVYDPEVTIRRAHLAGLDSVVLVLVDLQDSARRIEIWAGDPESPSRIRPYQAAEGESFHYLIEGYVAGRGLCYLESVGREDSRVLRNTCAPEPLIRMRDTVLVLSQYPLNPTLVLDSTALPLQESLVCEATVPWAEPSPGRFRLDQLYPGKEVRVTIDWDLVPPGPQDGFIRFLKGDTVAALVRISIRGALARSSILGGDTVHIGFFDESWSGTIILPANSAKWSEPTWLLGFPSEPSALTASVRGGMDGSPGARRELAVTFPSWPRNRALYDSVWKVFALHPDGTALDSLLFIYDRGPGFSLSGRVPDSEFGPYRDLEVRLDGGAMRTRTDSGGVFHFRGLLPGPHIVHIAPPGRIGSVTPFTMDSSGWADPVFPRYSKALAFSQKAYSNQGDPEQALIDGDLLVLAGKGQYSPDFAGNFHSVYKLDSLLKHGPRSFPLVGKGPTRGAPSEAPTAMAGSPNSIFLAFSKARNILVVGDWASATAKNETRTIRMDFQPRGMAWREPYLIAAGPDSTGEIHVAYFWGEHTEPVKTLATGIPWPGFPEGPASAEIRAFTATAASPGATMEVPVCQLFLPSAGTTGRLILLKPDPAGDRITELDLGQGAADFTDGLLAFQGAAAGPLRWYDEDLAARDSIPAPAGLLSLSARHSTGWLESTVAVLDGQSGIRFIERRTGDVYGPFPLPAGSKPLRIIPDPKGRCLGVLTNREIWMLPL